jgi:hypothetical protein
MQRGLHCRVALGYALKTLKPLEVIDGEATMVPRQAALWERLQCVAIGDGEALIVHLSRLLPT